MERCDRLVDRMGELVWRGVADLRIGWVYWYGEVWPTCGYDGCTGMERCAWKLFYLLMDTWMDG
jgi:hypothetical protein